MNIQKSLFFFLISSLSIQGIRAQARDASVMIDKENRNAQMIAFSHPLEITFNALKQRLERSGLKDKPQNGILRYKGVVFSEISPDKVDMFTKVEKGPNNSSVVYMAISKGYDNYTNGTTDATITANVKIFLESLMQDAENQSDDVKIAGQVNIVNEEEKKYQRLLDEQRELEKKKAGIESRLAEIGAEIRNRKDALDKKKADVDAAKDKRG